MYYLELTGRETDTLPVIITRKLAGFLVPFCYIQTAPGI